MAEEKKQVRKWKVVLAVQDNSGPQVRYEEAIIDGDAEEDTAARLLQHAHVAQVIGPVVEEDKEEKKVKKEEKKEENTKED